MTSFRGLSNTDHDSWHTLSEGLALQKNEEFLKEQVHPFRSSHIVDYDRSFLRGLGLLPFISAIKLPAKKERRLNRLADLYALFLKQKYCHKLVRA